MHADQILQRGLEPSHVATMPEGWTFHAAPCHHLLGRSKLSLLRCSMLEIFSLQTHFFTDIVTLHSILDSHHVHPSALLLELVHGNLAS